MLKTVSSFFSGKLSKGDVKSPINKTTPTPSREKNNSISQSRNSVLDSIRDTYLKYNPQTQPYNEYQKLEKQAMIAVSRDAIMNNPAMKHAMRIAKNAIVGTGWTLSLKPRYDVLGISQEEAEDWANKVESYFNVFASSPDCHFDASRKSTFTELLRTATQAYLQDGDCFGVMQWKPSTNGLFTCVQLIDSCRVKTPETLISDPTVKNGVRIDMYGEALEYFMANPYYQKGIDTLYNNEYFSVRRRTNWGRSIMLHIHDQQSPEQTTGTPEYLSGMYLLKLIFEYLETENQRNILQSQMAVVIKSNDDYKDVMTSTLGVKTSDDGEYGYVDEKLNAWGKFLVGAENYYNQLYNICKGGNKGAKVIHAVYGDDVSLMSKGDNINSLDSFTKVTNKMIASATGSDYATQFSDFSDMSYSAARFSASNVQLSYDVHKYIISQKFAMPLVHCFVEEMVDKGIIELPRGVDNFYLAKDFLLSGSFISRGKPIIDPLKEAKADTEELNNHTTTIQDICAEKGLDWRDVLEQSAREKRYAEKLGINLNEVQNKLSSVGDGLDANV